MSISQEEQVRFQNEVLDDWGERVEQVLKDQLKQRLGYVPDDVLLALRFRILAAVTANPSAQYLLNFQDEGRIVEMKEVDRRKRPITSDNNFILEWVKKYQDRFGNAAVPGYTAQSRIGISREKQLARIASAIIASKGGRSERISRKLSRRKKWYNKTFYKQVDELIRDLTQRQVELLAEGTKKNISEAFNQE
jgi:hypothetical protein